MGNLKNTKLILLKFFLLVVFIKPVLAHDLVYSRYLPDKVITLDPLESVERYSQSVILQIYDPLFRTEDGISPKPHIAKSFRYDPQTKTYYVKIRDDVYFQDGIQLTTDDVIFTLKRMCQYNFGTLKALPIIQGCRSKDDFGVKKINDYEFSIKLLEEFPPFMSFLSSSEFMILPKDLRGKKDDDFFKKPIGTGAFIIEAINNEAIILKKNESYFLGNPKIARLIYYTEPPGKIYSRVEEGTIDDIFPLPPRDSVPNNFEKVFINQTSSVFLAFNTKMNPFDSVEFRKAIRAAINNEEINTTLSKLDGLIPANGVVPWGAIGFDKKIANNYYDPEIVKELINETQYKTIENVPPLTIHCILKGNLSEDIPTIIRNSLQNLGFKVDIVQQSLPELMEDIKSQRVSLMLINLTMSSVDTYHFLELWRSSYPHPGLIVYDKEFDALLNKALMTPDRILRQEIYQEANELMSNKAYTHNIGYVINQVSLRKKGWRLPNMNFLGPFFYNMYDAVYSEEGN